HTTSYLYGKDYPLSLTAQYAGIGLWGMEYKITQPTQLNYALIPHKDKWDDANISNQSLSWNEPLKTYYDEGFSLLDKSFIDLEGSGYEISSVEMVDEELLIRLFNAMGNETERPIRFDFAVASVQEVLLNGQKVEDLAILRNAESAIVQVKMPRFGLKTLRTKKQNKKI